MKDCCCGCVEVARYSAEDCPGNANGGASADNVAKPLTSWSLRQQIKQLALEEFLSLCRNVGCETGDNVEACGAYLRVIGHLRNLRKE